MDDCERISDLVNKIEPLYSRLGKYLKQTNLNDSYINRIGKLNANILDAWNLLSQSELMVSDLVKDIETFNLVDRGSSTTNESRNRRTSMNSNRRLGESINDKLELKKLADDINALNDDRSWVEIKASVEKRQSSEQHICKVIVINHFYTNVADEYRVLQSNRGGFVIHYDNPAGSEWKDSYNQVLDYFENMVSQNIEL